MLRSGGAPLEIRHALSDFRANPGMDQGIKKQYKVGNGTAVIGKSVRPRQ